MPDIKMFSTQPGIDPGFTHLQELLPPPPTTMLAQTMVIGPQTNIVNGEGGKLGIF